MTRGESTTVWVLGDQLTTRSSAFEHAEPGETVVFMAETRARGRARPYHKQKLALVWSAMRHFAAELGERGYEVDYHRRRNDLRTALAAHLVRFPGRRIRLMSSSEYGVSDRLAALAEELGAEIDITPNNLFISTEASFRKRVAGKRRVMLEGFYRSMRRETGLLMDGKEPAGGRWNFDRENRQVPPAGHEFPPIPMAPPDALTAEVLGDVEEDFPDHFGELEGFSWPVDRTSADSFLEDFLEHRLDSFGPYEDAIVAGEPTLYHSLLAPLLNLGLLDPLDVCRRAEARYRDGSARLSSVEGFVRQILGWRELIFRVYHWQMPGYTERNELDAQLPLPEFYWSADTDMRCVSDAVDAIRRRGINHHIQRLMVTGNFALIAGIDPQAVNDWYRSAYVDAFDWVVSPNVLGMALYADGGVFATKPYASSANYIHRMSDLCGGCRYDRKAATDEDACPFNALYWDFLERHRERFQSNPRMGLVMNALRNKSDADRESLRARASELRRRLAAGERL